MASRSVNKVILLGNLGKDAETRYTPQGTARTTFSIATQRRWKDQQTGEWKEETDWHNILLWRGENVANFLTKGKQVYVEGRLQTRSYDDKDGNKRYITEIVADDLILLGGRGGDSAGGGGGMEASGGYGAGGWDSGGGAGGGGGPVSMPRSARAAAGAAGGMSSSRPAASNPPAQQPQDDGFGDQGVSDDDVPF
jgi:single-strand DNA-binding protein